MALPEINWHNLAYLVSIQSNMNYPSLTWTELN